MVRKDALRASLTAALPDAEPATVETLVSLLVKHLAKASPNNPLEITEVGQPGMAELLGALEGKELRLDQAAVPFGQANQFGDVVIHALAAGNIYELKLIVLPAHAEAQIPERRARPQISKRERDRLRLEITTIEPALNQAVYVRGRLDQALGRATDELVRINLEFEIKRQDGLIADYQRQIQEREEKLRQ